MATTYLKPKFNGYAYVGISDMFSRLTDGIGARLRVADPPGVDGGFTAGGLVAPRKLSVKGMMTIAASGVVQTDAATFRALRDNWNLVHAPGLPAPFFVDDDRYLNAEVESNSFPEWVKGLTNINYEVALHAADPYWYAANAYAPLFTSANLNVGGANVPASSTAQIARPTVAPTVAAHAAATALLAGNYTVGYTWVDAYGETQASPTSVVALLATQRIDVSALALPTGATMANLYVSIAAGNATMAWVQTWTGAAASITALPAGPNSVVVTPAGSVYSQPIIAIPVTAAPAGGRVYVTVTGGGSTWSLILVPTATGTYTVDCSRQQQIVTFGGGNATNVMSGVFPRLAAAANTIVVGLSGGATVGVATVQWQDRWL